MTNLGALKKPDTRFNFTLFNLYHRLPVGFYNGIINKCSGLVFSRFFYICKNLRNIKEKPTRKLAYPVR